MTIQDVEYIQELEQRISALEDSFTGKVDLLTIILLVISIALFIGSLVSFIFLFNLLGKYDKS